MKKRITTIDVNNKMNELMFNQEVIAVIYEGIIENADKAEAIFEQVSKFLSKEQCDYYDTWFEQAEHLSLKFEFAIISRDGLIDELLGKLDNLNDVEAMEQVKDLHKKVKTTLKKIKKFCDSSTDVLESLTDAYGKYCNNQEESQD